MDCVKCSFSKCLLSLSSEFASPTWLQRDWISIKSRDTLRCTVFYFRCLDLLKNKITAENGGGVGVFQNKT